MAGIRLHHRSERNCTLVVPHPGDRGRRPKNYYVQLDGDGNAIVSSTVWQRLEEARHAGWPHQLALLNAVTTPPAQSIILGGKAECQTRLVRLGRHR